MPPAPRPAVRTTKLADGKIRTLHTGARLSPRYKLLRSPPHLIVGTTPPQWPGVLPKTLEMWLNDQYGDCVTAEEAAAKALYSVVNGLAETLITDADVLAFCNKYGVRDGADLASVLDEMASDGFHQSDGDYKDGPKSGVDYSNEAVLQNALSQGPVKIAIGSGDLPSGAGNQSGWYALTANHADTDHCVGLWGYGPAEYLYQLLAAAYPGVQFPSVLSGKSGYLLYTWATVGFVTHDWLMGTCQEAWLRTPTTPGVVPTPPTPPTPPIPPTPPTPPGPDVLPPAVVALCQALVAWLTNYLANPGGRRIGGPYQDWYDCMTQLQLLNQSLTRLGAELPPGGRR